MYAYLIKMINMSMFWHIIFFLLKYQCCAIGF